MVSGNVPCQRALKDDFVVGGVAEAEGGLAGGSTADGCNLCVPGTVPHLIEEGIDSVGSGGGGILPKQVDGAEVGRCGKA